MVNVGISRGAAAAICASPAAIILSPTSGDVVTAAKAAEMPLIDFAFKTTLPISIAAIICMAIAHFSGSAIWIKTFLTRCSMSTTSPPPPRRCMPFCRLPRSSAC